MLICIVPDVHGRNFWKSCYEKRNDFDKIVFLGDYLDPYPDENITIEKAIDNFKTILEFKKIYSDKVILLLGNHDLHYIYDFQKSSRYNTKHAQEIKLLFTDNLQLFNYNYLVDKVLFTHAGVTIGWLKANNLTLEEWCQNPQNHIEALDQISIIRYGDNIYGSPTWADVRELIHDSEPTYYQVFGHTHMMQPVIGKYIACLDTAQCFSIDTRTLEILPIYDIISRSGGGVK